MNSSPVRSRSAGGFTLIELLTVITIIAILMAMLFPFIQGAKESARNRKADSDVRTIVHAVEQYNVEYGQYPRVSPAAGAVATDDVVGDTAANITINNSNLFNILRDIDKTPNETHSQNARRQVFMDTKVVSNNTAPRDGFLDSAAGGAGALGSLYDPWGCQYCIVIDTNSDNVLDVDAYYTDFKSPEQPRASVGAFSLGKDKQLGKNGDKKYRTTSSDTADDHLSWANK